MVWICECQTLEVGQSVCVCWWQHRPLMFVWHQGTSHLPVCEAALCSVPPQRERDRRHGLEECLHLASALWFTLCTSFADLKQTEGEWTSDKSVQRQLQIKNDPRHIAKQLHSVIISWWWRQSWSSAARCKHLASEQRFIVPMEAHLWTVKQWVPSCSKKYTRKQRHLSQHSGCLNLRSLQEAKLVHWGCHQHR